MKTISVAIPVRILKEEQYEALLRCLRSVFLQSVKPLDVIISVDGTPGHLITSLSNQFPNQSFRVVYNPNKPGIASNSNNALSYCKGDLVHILHQDDAIISNLCYESVLEKFKVEECKWLLLEGTTSLGKLIEPEFDIYTKFGINRIGGPSGLIVPKKWYLPFDPNYSMLTDVVNYELYFRMHGPPCILQKPWILYGDLSSSASRTTPREAVIKELRMVMNQFDVSNVEIRSFIANPELDLMHRKLVFDSIGSSINGISSFIFWFSYITSRIRQKLHFSLRRRPSWISRIWHK